jgi:hypothetical protein
MPLTRPIPPEALPIAEILRRDVARPSSRPRFRHASMDDGACVTPRIRWWGNRCPMGLHPLAGSPCPEWGEDFPPHPDDRAVSAFAWWFDAQTDYDAAVEAIWGTTDREVTA